MSTLKKKSAFDFGLVLKILCVLVMVAWLVCQWLPFWHYTSISEQAKEDYILYGIEPEQIEKDVSLGLYTWRASKHKDLFGEYDEGMENFEGEPLDQNDVVGMPALCTLLIVFGLVFFIANKKSLWPCLFPLSAGIYATYMYITDPSKTYHAGDTFQYHLIASIAMAVVAFVTMFPWIVSIVKWFTVKKRHY